MSRPAGSGSDVLIIGGGVIGLAIAWRAAQRGLRVTVADPEPGRGASHAAAGMLTPVSEAAYAERALFTLGQQSLQRYPAFVAELTAATGEPTGFRDDGTLQVAYDHDDLAVLDEIAILQKLVRRAVTAALGARVPGGRADARPVGPRRAAGPGRRLGGSAAADHGPAGRGPAGRGDRDPAGRDPDPRRRRARRRRCPGRRDAAAGGHRGARRGLAVGAGRRAPRGGGAAESGRSRGRSCGSGPRRPRCGPASRPAWSPGPSAASCTVSRCTWSRGPAASW